MDNNKKVEEIKHDGGSIPEVDEVIDGDCVDNENVRRTWRDETDTKEEVSNLTDSVDGSDKKGEESHRGEDEQEAIAVENDDKRPQSQNAFSNSTAEQTDVGESAAKDINSSNTVSTDGSNDSHSYPTSISPKKAKRRAIFVSYSPEASFIEKRFISYTIKELKNIGFCDDIWFDKDDCAPVESPCCFQQRLENAEKCRASIMFLSESYFSSRACRHERRILLKRDENRELVEEKDEIEKPVKLFCIKYTRGKLPMEYKQLGTRFLDLSSYPGSSAAELSSVVVGAFSEDLEKYAPMFGLRIPTPPGEPDILSLDRKKPVSLWNISDVLSWLTSLKMQAHYSLSFEEHEIDGFVLVSMNEMDLEKHLNVDSRVARKKLVQQIKKIRDDQAQMEGNWYLKCQKTKVKGESVYIICDPSDVRVYQNLWIGLEQKNFQVFKHERLGQSRDEFLQLNAPHLASCRQVIILLSDTAATSLFVYNEVLFADWLGKPFVIVMVTNSWSKLRPNMQAILGGCPAVDFECRPLEESLEILLYHLKPFRKMPAVILEQEFLDRMAEGLRPLRVLAANHGKSNQEREEVSTSRPNLYLSYHWDVQNKVQLLVQYLENHGFQCWTDVSNPNKRHSASHAVDNGDNLQTRIQRKIKAAAAVVCCVTPKYIRSENCTKDLSIAESMNKPVVPVMFQWLAWPPEGVRVRRILAPLPCIDMSNNNLFKRHLSTVETHLRRCAAKHSSHDIFVTDNSGIPKYQHGNPNPKLKQRVQ
ncbi:uncharacterized protein [Montipora capricornis]|uniref:uncharacterized protein n=1 Tax=Montipora capricornis TaxID=246305 RepID=UPI0035F1E4B1